MHEFLGAERGDFDVRSRRRQEIEVVKRHVDVAECSIAAVVVVGISCGTVQGAHPSAGWGQ